MSHIPDNEHWHPIELLRLSGRSYNALLKAGISTIEHAVKMEYALTAIRGLGQKGITEIRNAVAEWKQSGIGFDTHDVNLILTEPASLGEVVVQKTESFVTQVHPIQLLPLTPGSEKALLNAGITTVEGALKLENFLDGIPGLGESATDRIRQSLAIWKETKIVPEDQDISGGEDTSVSFTSFQDLFQQIVNRYTTGKKGGTSDNRRDEIIMARFTGHTSYDEKHTLEGIGQKFGLTRERIRQICEQFMLYLDFYFGYYLQQRIISLSEKLSKRGIFDFDTFRHITISVFPEFSDTDVFDFLHLLQTKNEIFEVTDAVEANKKLLLFSYKLHVPTITKIRSCITDCINKSKMTSAKEIVAYVSSEFEIEKEVVRRIISYSKIFTINDGQIVRRKMSRGDMLLAVFEKEKRDMHFSEAVKLVNEQFSLNLAGHNAQGVLLADERFIWVGQGKFALARPGLLRGKTEDVIEHFLKTKGGSASLQEIIVFMKTQRSLSDAAIGLGIQRSLDIVRVKPGVFRLKAAHENKKEIQLANTNIKLKQGLMQVLRQATEPLSNTELAQKIKEQFGNKCSSDTKTISVYLNRDMKHLVYKNSKKKYMLYSNQNFSASE